MTEVEIGQIDLEFSVEKREATERLFEIAYQKATGRRLNENSNQKQAIPGRMAGEKKNIHMSAVRAEISG